MIALLVVVTIILETCCHTVLIIFLQKLLRSKAGRKICAKGGLKGVDAAQSLLAVAVAVAGTTTVVIVVVHHYFLRVFQRASKGLGWGRYFLLEGNVAWIFFFVIIGTHTIQLGRRRFGKIRSRIVVVVAVVVVMIIIVGI